MFRSRPQADRYIGISGLRFDRRHLAFPSLISKKYLNTWPRKCTDSRWNCDCFVSHSQDYKQKCAKRIPVLPVFRRRQILSIAIAFMSSQKLHFVAMANVGKSEDHAIMFWHRLEKAVARSGLGLVLPPPGENVFYDGYIAWPFVKIQIALLRQSIWRYKARQTRHLVSFLLYHMHFGD